MINTAGPRAALPLLLAHPMFTPAYRQQAVKEKLTAILSDYTKRQSVNADPVMQLDPPAIERLQNIEAPTLILIGELDMPDFHSIATILAEQILHAVKIEFADVGHVLVIEAPEKLNQVITDFLR